MLIKLHKKKSQPTIIKALAFVIQFLQGLACLDVNPPINNYSLLKYSLPVKKKKIQVLKYNFMKKKAVLSGCKLLLQ